MLAEHGNKAFAESLNPGIEHVLGIRVPELRQLARKIAADDWKVYLQSADTYYMEERMLYGLVLGYIRPLPDIEAYLEMVSEFVCRIRGWAICDVFTFGGGKPYVLRHATRIWIYLKEKMMSGDPNGIRFGVVMSLKYFADEIHANEFFRSIEHVDCDAYYVRMGIAWAVAEYFIKCPETTMKYLENSRLDVFTYNKALQKITESFRVSQDTKQRIKQMKR